MNGEKTDPSTGGHPPPPRMVVTLREFLPLLERITRYEGALMDDLFNGKAKEATELAAHLALVLTTTALQLHEMEARLALMASALLAGDTLVQKRQLLLPDTARVLERWCAEAARGQSDLAELAARLKR